MKYWEFLIQKEGDQTWLPLETQQVEILEGRYRVVAHTDRANTSMEVRVSQLVTDEMPPRRRVRKRVSTTNDSGLVVAMPFVNLQPGQWDLKCSSLDGAVGESWQYSVQLQVFAHTEEDWSNEWPVPNDDETVASVTLEGDGELDPDLVNQDLPLIQAQAELEANLPDTPKKVAEAPSYQVALKQQAYLAHPQLPMTIVGKVSSLAGLGTQQKSQLWIRLQNPETAQVIMEASRPLSLARLPADFKVQIQLPAEVSTRVILGEVSLRSEASEGGESSSGGEILAATSFTISAGIAELLEAIANQDTDTFSGVFEEEIISMPSLSPVQTKVSPAVGVVLPPKLEPSDYAAASSAESVQNNGYAQPTLPDFANADTAANLIVSEVPDAVNPDVAEADVAVPDITVSDGVAEPVTGDELERVDDTFPPVDLAQPVQQHPELSYSQLAEPVIERAPMVAQPAQFLGTSVEDSDIEADEIAAVLEDIDRNLSTEETDLETLEAPGIEAALPQVPVSDSKHHHALADEHAANLEALEAARAANRRATSRQPLKQSPRQIEAGLDFKALRLKDHFWNRLSTLTHESHKEATQLAERMREAGVSKEQVDGNSLVSQPRSRVNNEVVIYPDSVSDVTHSRQPEQMANDAALLPSAGQSLTPATSSKIADRLLGSKAPMRGQTNSLKSLERSSGDSPSAGISASQPTQSFSASSPPSQPPSSSASGMNVPGMSVPNANIEDLPEMALPVISVPMGDLVAGEIITVTIRTRPSVYKPFIKVWMVDRQSRSLVIDPKLLTNLTPDALGDLETSTQLQIPMHCLDVQIAAIAVDMATQQESAKAIVNRHVVPADQAASIKGMNL